MQVLPQGGPWCSTQVWSSRDLCGNRKTVSDRSGLSSRSLGSGGRQSWRFLDVCLEASSGGVEADGGSLTGSAVQLE